MRYYKIEISDPSSGAIIKTFSSLNDAGETIRGALQIELDIPVFRLAEPAGAAYVRIWGISIQDIGQAFDLNNKDIKVYAGMSKGLPLANPSQAGLILQGTITQAFGNWQALEQTLDFVINAAGPGSNNIVLNWQTGQTLGAAVQAALAVGFPGFTFVDKTSKNLVLNQPEQGFYSTIAQFSAYVKEVSQHIISDPQYQGVDITINNNQFTLYDGTSPTTPTAIEFIDLIGQPTWIDFQKIQFKCVMRADLNVGDYVKLPPSQITTSAQSQSQYRDGSVFSGSFQLISVRHVGNFRQADANSWVTVMECTPTFKAATS